VPIVVEAVAMRDLRVDAADRQVHLGEPPGRVIRFLAVNRDVTYAAAMRLDELLALNEHSARPAARVIDPALIGCQHLDEHAHDMGRRVKLAALLALGAGKLRQEVYVDLAKDVAGAVGQAAEADIADEIDQLAEPLLVEARTGIILRQDGFERGVVALDRRHRVIYDLPDRRLGCRALEV